MFGKKAQKKINEIDMNGIPEPKQENSLIKEAFVFLWEIIKVVVISLAVILPIRYFLIQPFYVKGASMEPNFQDHQYLIVDQISYRFGEPTRGDVVVFRAPPQPYDFFIKRVIGLPGETIKIRDGSVFIFSSGHPQGEELQESYLSAGLKSVGTITEALDQDEYFLMGDNRPESMDSRSFGPVKRKAMVGKVFLRGWPLDKFSLYLDPPQYGF